MHYSSWADSLYTIFILQEYDRIMANDNSPAPPPRIEGPTSERTSGFQLLVIGQVAAGLVIVGLVFYSFQVVDDNNRLSQQLAQILPYAEQGIEKTDLIRFDQLAGSGSGKFNMMVRISNQAPISTSYPYVLLYCTSAPGCSGTSGDPVINPASITFSVPLTLEAGEQIDLPIGPIDDGLTYRIDVITERGNVVSTDECMANVAEQICESARQGSGLK